MLNRRDRARLAVGRAPVKSQERYTAQTRLVKIKAQLEVAESRYRAALGR